MFSEIKNKITSISVCKEPYCIYPNTKVTYNTKEIHKYQLLERNHR